MKEVVFNSDFIIFNEEKKIKYLTIYSNTSIFFKKKKKKLHIHLLSIKASSSLEKKHEH
jgi:hypothetical protein